MSSWEPIETAPKNGRWILIFRPFTEFDWFDVVYWREDDCGNGTWVDPGDVEESCADPTHWMPLPEPPRSELTEMSDEPESAKVR